MTLLRTASSLALAAFLWAGSALASKVTFVVTGTPKDTPPDATLTLGANINGWNPAAPGHAFRKGAGGRHTLTLELREGTSVEFKLTRGSWETVEKGADGSELRNRTLLVKGRSTVRLKVARWADGPGAPAPKVSTITGQVEKLEGVKSPELGNARDLLVYLPPGYAKGDRRYPVLYMHDAQNVFDASTAFVGQEWKADETAEALARRGLEVIIVAVSNNADRKSEYTPFPAPLNEYKPKGAEYVAFIVKTVKPMIDAKYRTRPEREHTGIAGSSLGGLISLYAAVAQPDVFGFAGVVSPALGVADFSAFEWVREHPAKEPLRVYLDMGDREAATPGRNLVMLEAVEDMAKLLREQGHQTKVVIDKGAHHNEDAWARRFPAALEWFLAGKK